MGQLPRRRRFQEKMYSCLIPALSTVHGRELAQEQLVRQLKPRRLRSCSIPAATQPTCSIPDIEKYAHCVLAHEYYIKTLGVDLRDSPYLSSRRH
jgi:hypothetical protein